MNKAFRLLLLPLLSSCLSSCNASSNAYEAIGVEQYDKSAIVEKYHANIDSNLSIFPDEIKAVEGTASYYAFISDEFFDKNPEVFLQCEYTVENYLLEIERLKSISITIKYRDQSYTNYIKYDEEMYTFPAYIAIDGFGSKYEYALLNEKEHVITYLYLAYPGKDQFEKYPDYVKENHSLYNKSGLDCFTIYAHSFDGGRSYVEFDD